MIDNNTPLKFQPFYCEENIWQLCQHPKYLGGQVIFIASYGEYFPMLCQKGCSPSDYPIFWDYHVVLLQAGNILDFNSTLSFSTPIQHYFEQSFIPQRLLKKIRRPMFRVLSAEEYVASFLSDRRHMKSTAGWHVTPPDWPLISENSSNLKRFIDMRDLEFGEVLNANQLLTRFANVSK